MLLDGPLGWARNQGLFVYLDAHWDDNLRLPKNSPSCSPFAGPSVQETGAQRGCVVICSSATDRLLYSLSLLRPATERLKPM
jgi:hypothetical protein